MLKGTQVYHASTRPGAAPSINSGRLVDLSFPGPRNGAYERTVPRSRLSSACRVLGARTKEVRKLLLRSLELDSQIFASDRANGTERAAARERVSVRTTSVRARLSSRRSATILASVQAEATTRVAPAGWCSPFALEQAGAEQPWQGTESGGGSRAAGTGHARRHFACTPDAATPALSRLVISQAFSESPGREGGVNEAAQRGRTGVEEDER